MADWVTFNVNNYVKIKLSERGRRILENHYGWEPYHIPNWFGERYIDNEGYFKFQMWDAMYIFGKHLTNGYSNLPFKMSDFKFLSGENP